MPFPADSSDHFDGRHYFNPSGAKAKALGDVLRWQLTSRRTPWPAHVENPPCPPPPPPSDKTVVATWVNHSTVLLQTKQGAILTDPIWSKRASPLSFAGPKRVREPGLAFEKLPPIRVVLLSHNHYDHCDLPTIRRLEERDQPLFITTLGNKELLLSFGCRRVVELDWWGFHPVAVNLLITMTPAQHFSARGLADRDRTLWGGFWLEAGSFSCYFAGDTGYSSHFEAIHQRLGRPDLSLLPIGAYEPRWFMRNIHMSPEEAVQAHQELNSRHSFAIHHGTFPLADEGLDDPADALRTSLLRHHVAADQFRILEHGESWVIPVR